jgi:hypothetical protein
MFGVGTVELLGLALLICVVVIVIAAVDPWLTASQTLEVEGLTVAELDKPVHGLLGRTRSSELTHTGTGTFVLVVRRTPPWVWIPALLTFPLGLLLLVLIKRSEALLVVLSDVEAGTEVRIIGRTKQSVVRTLAKGLGSLRTVVNVR